MIKTASLLLATLVLTVASYAQQVASDLPALQITGIDGKSFSVKSLKGKTVIVMYQPDCDHCQREATQIQQNIAAFKAYQIYFITTAPAAEVKKFAAEYKLNMKASVHFGTTTLGNILSTYGPIETPSLYIYNATGGLVKKFNGETDIQVIKKHL
jgi:peroxiredoxin